VPTSSFSSTSQPPPPTAGPETLPADGDKRSPKRGQLTEEALRQRIERVLVEMIADSGNGDESKVAAALRQAIVDSAAFPTLFTD